MEYRVIAHNRTTGTTTTLSTFAERTDALRTIHNLRQQVRHNLGTEDIALTIYTPVCPECGEDRREAPCASLCSSNQWHRYSVRRYFVRS